MSTPFVGKIFFERGDDGSPATFTRVCTVFSMSGLGKNNALEEVTTFCSEGQREYIAGLADGKEVTIQANYDQSDSTLASLITDVETGRVGQYRIVVTQASPNKYFEFAGVALDWDLQPSIDSKNIIAFTIKISGAIVQGTTS